VRLSLSNQAYAGKKIKNELLLQKVRTSDFCNCVNR